MHVIEQDVNFGLNNSLYKKDPQESELGRKIIEHSIIMINELGFESFTFKKLADKIQSTEKSIYRYFGNKQLLLLFLSSWYWDWVHFIISKKIKDIQNPTRRLDIAIDNIVSAKCENGSNKFINLYILHRVVVREGGKAYRLNAIVNDNRVGLFLSYRKLVKLIANIISDINPNFKYSASLASNLFEMANNQKYFAEHLPKLCSIKSGNEQNQDLIDMLRLFAHKILVK